MIADQERAAALELLSRSRACSTGSSTTSSAAAWWASTPTSSSATWPRSRRKLERPLAVMVQSSSAAGKSALMNAVLAFVPEEERVAYSAMTGQSLFYMGETDLKHKVLAIAEEEGAERASYALKLLQSEGELSIASTGKDPTTGRLVTHEYQVEGPAAIFMTTTAIDLDEELHEPLPRADRRRGPRADPGHPPHPAPAADARRPDRSPPPRRAARAPPQRPAPAAAPCRSSTPTPTT